MTTQRPGTGVCKGPSNSEQPREALHSHIAWNPQAWKLFIGKEHTQKKI